MAKVHTCSTRLPSLDSGNTDPTVSLTMVSLGDIGVIGVPGTGLSGCTDWLAMWRESLSCCAAWRLVSWMLIWDAAFMVRSWLGLPKSVLK